MRKHRLIAAALLCVGPAVCAAQSVGDLNARCEVSLDKADYKAAANSCRTALGAAAKQPGSEALVRALINMASYYTDRAQDAEAVPLTDQAFDIEQRSTAGNQLQARNLDDLGVVLQQKARYADAEATLKRALELKERLHGPDSAETAKTLTFLGLLFRDQHKFDKAVPFFQRALDIDEKTLGSQDPTTTMIRNDLNDATEQAQASPVIRYNHTPQIVQPNGQLAPASAPAPVAPAPAPMPAPAPAAVAPAPMPPPAPAPQPMPAPAPPPAAAPQPMPAPAPVGPSLQPSTDEPQ